jgi:Spy/CpxP family protein refolding chaperone
MKLIANLFVAFLCLASVMLSAQEASNAPARDPIAEQVLPPELVMQHQKAISLSDSQKNSVIAEIKRAQGRIVDLQWDLQRAMERLVELLRQDKADEQMVIAQLDSVLAVEREMKHMHLALAVRVKNILAPEQQRMLRELRKAQTGSGDAATRR